MKLLNEIQQKLVAPKSRTNTQQNYKYRSCDDILEAVKPLLGKAVLTLSDEMICLGYGQRDNVTTLLDKKGTQTTTISPDSRYYVKATATLTDGLESISCSAYAREPYMNKFMDEPKLSGSTSSYARKYALNGLFCIDDAKDPDSFPNEIDVPNQTNYNNEDFGF